MEFYLTFLEAFLFVMKLVLVAAVTVAGASLALLVRDEVEINGGWSQMCLRYMIAFEFLIRGRFYAFAPKDTYNGRHRVKDTLFRDWLLERRKVFLEDDSFFTDLLAEKKRQPAHIF